MLNRKELKEEIIDCLKQRNPDILDISVVLNKVKKEEKDWIYLIDYLKAAEKSQIATRLWLQEAIDCFIIKDD